MLSLCDRTLQTRVENIPGKQGYHVRETVVLRRGSVVFHDGLKSFDAADRIRRAWSMHEYHISSYVLKSGKLLPFNSQTTVSLLG